MQAKHNFGFGDTYGIREAICKIAPWLSISPFPIEKLGYPKHEGQDELVDLVRKLIRKLTGKNYQHILITQGCTHALNAYIYAEKDGHTSLATRRLYFPFYPGIAEINGLIHNAGDIGNIKSSIQILDSPSNPEGIVDGNDYGRVVWDAAYYSPTFGVSISGSRTLTTSIPPHIAMAGSMSKMTGINGIRIGWLATNDENLYLKAARFVTYDICGVSGLSQHLAVQILKKVDLDSFWKRSKLVLDDNRTEIQKLAYLFGDQEIPKMGMFALFEIDNKLKRLFEKASVFFISGKICGDDRDSVRINLAQTNLATKAMVKAVLKADKKR